MFNFMILSWCYYLVSSGKWWYSHTCSWGSSNPPKIQLWNEPWAPHVEILLLVFPYSFPFCPFILVILLSPFLSFYVLFLSSIFIFIFCTSFYFSNYLFRRASYLFRIYKSTQFYWISPACISPRGLEDMTSVLLKTTITGTESNLKSANSSTRCIVELPIFSGALKIHFYKSYPLRCHLIFWVFQEMINDN